jgi:hypothetical protein
MNRTLLNRVIAGDQEAVAGFGEAEHCAVIDWRDDFDEIVAAVAPFLPEGYVTVRHDGEDACQLLVRGKAPGPISLSPGVRQETHFQSINDALKPEFELRQFRPFDGDSYSLFVAPSSLWSEIEAAHPHAVERLFLPIDRLVAYRRKGYLARLFSKP